MGRRLWGVPKPPLVRGHWGPGDMRAWKEICLERQSSTLESSWGVRRARL